MSNKNFTTLNIGGVERTLKFSMNALEMFMLESKKRAEEIDTENDFTRIKLVIYCALKVGDRDTKSLPADFSLEMVGDWIDDCDQAEFDETNELAIAAMGFIESAEKSTFDRRMNQLKAIGKNPADLIDKALLMKS